MKVAALALLLANLVLLGWVYTHPQQQPSGAIHATPYAASVEPLVLLRERPKTAESISETPPVEAQAEPIPEAVIPQPTSDQIGTAQVAIPAVPESPGETLTPETADAVPQPAATSATAPASSEPAPAPPTERLCQAIGPFPERAQAEEFMGALAASGRELAIRAAQIEQPSGYWVYLPSMPRDEAERTIDDLAAKGVKDYFLGRQNFISLGVFSDKRSAETRVRDITVLGYAPRLEPRFLTREVFWIDLEESSPGRIEDAQWQELLGRRPELRRQTVACE